MPKFVKKPTKIRSAGKMQKLIEEFFGRVNTKTEEVSVARMKSPEGWEEPAQKPEFNEYTVVFKGALSVKTEKEIIKVEAGQAILVNKGERIQYSTPYKGGAEYIAVCLPAFSPETVHRDS